jgi:altronate dehydratase
MTDPTHDLSAETINSLLVDTSPYLSCDDCFAQVDEYVERRIADPRFDDAAMKAHLAGCGACAEEAESLRELLSHDGD